MTGDLVAAVGALDGALALEPRNLLALLSKGALLERLRQAKAAALVYKNALAVAAAVDDLPPVLAAQVERARMAVTAHTAALAAHLRASVADLRA